MLKRFRVCVNFIYPPLCLHCSSKLSVDKHLVCQDCRHFFELIDPFNRCPYCFTENDGRRPCVECVRKKRGQVKMAAALDYHGAVSSLVKGLKHGRFPYLAKTGAAFMTAQFERLGWPLPDYITAVPRRHWFQGMNHAELLARQFAKNLGIKCVSLVKRKPGDFSQARLSQRQREKLSGSNFHLVSNVGIEDKIILIVDDVLTTGTTLRRTAEAIGDGFPSRIFGFCLAKSIS